MSPYMKGMLSQMIQQRIIPEYSTVGALIRDAVAHRLKQLAVEFGDQRIEYTANQILMYEHQMARAERRQREEKLVAQFVENLHNAPTEDDKDEIISEMRAAVDMGMVRSQSHIAQLKQYL